MPTPTYEPLASVTITTAQTQVTFSNIPQTYTDLVLVISGGGSSSGDSTVFRVNGDSGTNYSSTELYGTGSAAGSQRSTSATFGRITFSSDFGTTLTSNSIMNFMNYSNNVTNKTVISRSNVPSSTYPSTDAIVSLWRNTASINSILVYPTSGNWLVDTTFNLYGVGANTLKATGGDIITTDGTYWYHAFRTSGTFTPASTLSWDVLVLAGGGGGGFDNGGGAGAGVAYQTGRSVSSATTITVGAGGAGSSSSSIPGSSGSDSIFATITANGGGGGGSGGLATGARNGRSGGSGGGASRNGTVGSANQGTSGGATGYGFAGGAGYDADPYDGGGGGGAGAVGFSGTAISSPRTGGGGGAGLNTWSSWASVTGTGVNGLYAGGGGAGGYSTTIVAGGAGGSGGGGNGGFWSGTVAISRPQTGVVNTGSGGGGGASGDAGATGGSGLVIVRYAV